MSEPVESAENDSSITVRRRSDSLSKRKLTARQLQKAYWDGNTAFDEAMRAHDYPMAAQVMKLTLPVVEDALSLLFSDESSGLPSHAVSLPPLIHVLAPRALDIAALYVDEEVDSFLEHLSHSELLSDRVDYAGMLDTRTLMQRALTLLRNEGPLTRSELRENLAPSDGRRFARALASLGKSRFLHETSGLFHFGPSPANEQPKPEEPFRQLGEAPEFVVPDLTEIVSLQDFKMRPSVWERYREERDRAAQPQHVLNPSDSALPVKPAKDEVFGPRGTLMMVSTPPAQRIQGSPSVKILSDHTWLFNTKQPTGGAAVSVVRILDRDGATVRTMELRDTVVRSYSWPDRSWISLLYGDKVVHVHREDGELLDVINLSENVDIAGLAKSMDEPVEKVYWLRAFDYDPDTQAVLYTYGDHVVVAARAGEVLHAIRMPSTPEHSENWPEQRASGSAAEALEKLALPMETSLRQAASWLQATGAVKATNIKTVAERLNAYVGTIGDPPPRRVLNPPRTPKIQLARSVGPLSADPIQHARFTATGFQISADSGLNLAFDDDGLVVGAWQTPGAAIALTMTADQHVEIVQAEGDVIRIGHQVISLEGRPQQAIVTKLAAHDRRGLGGPSWVAYWDKEYLHLRYERDWHQAETYQLPKPLNALHAERGGIRVHVGIRSFFVTPPSS